MLLRNHITKQILSHRKVPLRSALFIVGGATHVRVTRWTFFCSVRPPCNRVWCSFCIFETRMHSSRMRTVHCSGRISCHARPHARPLPCMPPAMHAPCHAPLPCPPPAMHTPLPCMPLPHMSPYHACPPLPHMTPCHAHPPPCMPPYHACPTSLPCMPPHPCHTCPLTMHAPLPYMPSL